MRRLMYAVIATAIAALPGCAAAPGTAPAVSPSTSSPGTTPVVSPSTSSAAVVTVTEADGGRSITLKAGQRLEVYLRGTPQSLWTQPSADGSALQVATSGKLALQRGVTGAAFVAAQAGSASVTSTRPLCPDASPGTGACQGMQSFVLTVVVQ